jgi:maltokinase
VLEGPEGLWALGGAAQGFGPEVLLPERLRGTVGLPPGLELADALALDDAGDVALAVLMGGGEVVTSPLVREGDGVRRAEAGDGAFERIWGAMRAGAVAGRFRARSFGEVRPALGERPIDVDQSNDSFVVGDGVVVKLYPRTIPGAQPGLDLPAHLRAVGFGDTPALMGALVWDGPQGEPVVLATASAFLPGARDGWDWYVSLVGDSLDDGADAVAPARSIGELVARLHVALATPSEVLPEPLRETTPSEVQGWRARAAATLDEALEVTGGEEGERLQGRAARARRALDELERVSGCPVMRIHGDLHVGQILEWEEGLAVSDFDGNPLAPAHVRAALDTPMRDVASMARALDHVGRVVQRRRPEDAGRIESWIKEARRSFLDAYRSEMRAAGDPVPFVDELLLPLEVAQECHEYVYAARYLPRWLYVPDLAMPALLRGDSTA